MGAPAPRVPVANQHIEKSKVRTVSERPNGLKADFLEEAIANVGLNELLFETTCGPYFLTQLWQLRQQRGRFGLRQTLSARSWHGRCARLAWSPGENGKDHAECGDDAKGSAERLNPQ